MDLLERYLQEETPLLAQWKAECKALIKQLVIDCPRLIVLER